MSRPAIKDRVRDARQAMYRELLLDAAEEVFAEKGYDAAKVQAVAKAAGVSLATLYGVFETKMALYRGVHARRLATLLEMVLKTVEATPDAPLIARALDGIGVWITFHAEHANYLRMHLREGNAWTSPDTLRSDEQRQAWRHGFALMARVVGELMDTGELRKDDPDLIGRMSVAMQQVRLLLWVERGMKEPVAELTRYLQLQFLRAFAAPERMDALIAEYVGSDEVGDGKT